MPIRNPFARRTAAVDDTAASSSAQRPGSAGAHAGSGAGPDAAGNAANPSSFERVDTVGSMASSSVSVRSRKSQDTGDYKMSVVNDSGVYLPPSPTERDAFWSTATPTAPNGHHGGHRRTYITSLATLSRSSTENTGRSSLGDIESFSISRESFDSYRRSFDISAKSPVVGGVSEWGAGGGAAGRQSLDSATARAKYNTGASRQSRLQQRFPPADEGFEDVGLDDRRQAAGGVGGGGPGSAASAFIRKRGGFFSKFGGDHADGADSPAAGAATAGGTATPSTTPISRFLMPSRKRAPSGQGAELTPMDRNTSRPVTPAATTPTQPPTDVQS